MRFAGLTDADYAWITSATVLFVLGVIGMLHVVNTSRPLPIRPSDTDKSLRHRTRVLGWISLAVVALSAIITLSVWIHRAPETTMQATLVRTGHPVHFIEYNPFFDEFTADLGSACHTDVRLIRTINDTTVILPVDPTSGRPLSLPLSGFNSDDLEASGITFCP